MSTSFTDALQDVAAAFGAYVADALRRAVLRDCADAEEHPDTGVLRSAGRFAWFEASGPFFGKNRYALEHGEVSWLPTPIYRDELRGASALLARYTPLTEADVGALIVVLDAFGDGKLHFMRDERSRYIARGRFVAETHRGDDEDDELARRGRVEVELATAAITVVTPDGDADGANADADADARADAMLRDDALRAMLVSAHKNARRSTEGSSVLGAASEHDLEDPTHVDAHPPIAAQRHASASDELEEATVTTDVDKTRRDGG